MHKLTKYNIPAIVWGLVILYILLTPGSNIPKIPWLAIMHIDKLVHFGLFFVLSVLFVVCRVYEKKGGANIKFYIVIITIGIVYGSTLEYIQPLITTDRVRGIYDALFNALGTIIGVLVFCGVPQNTNA